MSTTPAPHRPVINLDEVAIEERLPFLTCGVGNEDDSPGGGAVRPTAFRLVAAAPHVAVPCR